MPVTPWRERLLHNDQRIVDHFEDRDMEVVPYAEEEPIFGYAERCAIVSAIVGFGFLEAVALNRDAEAVWDSMIDSIHAIA